MYKACKGCGGKVTVKQSNFCNQCKNYPQRRKEHAELKKQMDKFLYTRRGQDA